MIVTLIHKITNNSVLKVFKSNALFIQLLKIIKHFCILLIRNIHI